MSNLTGKTHEAQPSRWASQTQASFLTSAWSTPGWRAALRFLIMTNFPTPIGARVSKIWLTSSTCQWYRRLSLSATIGPVTKTWISKQAMSSWISAWLKFLRKKKKVIATIRDRQGTLYMTRSINMACDLVLSSWGFPWSLLTKTLTTKIPRRRQTAMNRQTMRERRRTSSLSRGIPQRCLIPVVEKFPYKIAARIKVGNRKSNCLDLFPCFRSAITYLAKKQ